MKILAPLVITGLLSLILYRQTGTLTPVEVYPKSRYDQDAGGYGGGYQPVPKNMRTSSPQFTEGAIDDLEDRKFGGRAQYPDGGGIGDTHDNPITMNR